VEILKLLEQYLSITQFEVEQYKSWELGFYVRLKITFKDNSVLFVKEYTSETERNYSYHWQSKEGDLIIRWDNAPHYKKIKTFPHHRHVGSKVFESYEITLKDILVFIDERVN
jgi:Family of unknown function (DUF6516)